VEEGNPELDQLEVENLELGQLQEMDLRFGLVEFRAWSARRDRLEVRLGGEFILGCDHDYLPFHTSQRLD